MDLQHVLSLFDRDQRRDIVLPGMRREVSPPDSGSIVRHIIPAPEMSFILYSELDDNNVDRVIEEQLDYFTANKLSMEWKTFSHDQPADLLERLVRRGFEPDEEGAVMALDLGAAPSSLLAPPTADVRRLTHPDQLADVVAVLGPVWNENFDWVPRRLGSHMQIPDYLSVFVAYVGEQPACAGWTYYYKGKFAGLWGGSTLSEYRGRGLYTAVLAARAQEAWRRGVGYLTIDAGPMSRPIVARHGFQVITYTTSANWPAGESGE